MQLRGCCSGCVLSLFIVLLLVAIAGTCVGPAHAQARLPRLPRQARPHWVDGVGLIDLADSAHIDERATLAIAWEESRDNLNPHLRGHHCWYSYMTVSGDSVRVRHHHDPDCEVGRFQIKPSTARRRCPGLDIFTYGGNTRCFAKMFAADAAYRDIAYAITHHNGRGPRAREYLNRVLAVIGWIAVTYPEAEKT
jgi:hypothetical protein